MQIRLQLKPLSPELCEATWLLLVSSIIYTYCFNRFVSFLMRGPDLFTPVHTSPTEGLTALNTARHVRGSKRAASGLSFNDHDQSTKSLLINSASPLIQQRPKKNETGADFAVFQPPPSRTDFLRRTEHRLVGTFLPSSRSRSSSWNTHRFQHALHQNRPDDVVVPNGSRRLG